MDNCCGEQNQANSFRELFETTYEWLLSLFGDLPGLFYIWFITVTLLITTLIYKCFIIGSVKKEKQS